MPRTVAPLTVTPEHKTTLERWVRAKGTPQAVVLRARIALLAAGGASTSAVAEELETTRATVDLWRDRFAEAGPEGLRRIAPGRGRKRSVATAGKVKAVVEATLHEKPRGRTHWSCRSMAKAQGLSPATVQRIWAAHGLKPHRQETFKLSRDRHFVDKLVDVVGLYLNPPDKAFVLCVDEKSQIQALQRTQPGLPMKKGSAGTMTHDYKRHGTTTLFAALDFLEGSVVTQCHDRHRHQEFLKFLQKLDAEFPDGFDLHLVVDNYGTHKHPRVKSWLKCHPRFHLHFVPTSSSWLNLVERWFRDLTQQAIRRGSFTSVGELVKAIYAYADAYNEDPTLFIWTASAEAILEKIGTCRAIYETLH